MTLTALVINEQEVVFLSSGVLRSTKWPRLAWIGRRTGQKKHSQQQDCDSSHLPHDGISQSARACFAERPGRQGGVHSAAGFALGQLIDT